MLNVKLGYVILSILFFINSLQSQRPSYGPKQPCNSALVKTADCAANCSFDQWAKKIRSLKERPIEFSSLPTKQKYQENILTRQEFLAALQKAANSIEKDCASRNQWLRKKTVKDAEPDIFTLDRPSIKPVDDVKNFPFHPYIRRLVLPPGSKAALFGDLHGSVHTLIRDLEKIRDLGYIDDQFKITKNNFYLIFLGDYIDRGIYGVEVIYTLARLKIANPRHVIVIRGNHEDYILAPEFRKHHTKEEQKDNDPSFIDELFLKFDAITQHDEITIFRFYETLPVALYLGSGNKTHHDFMQCCHGGIELGYNPHTLLHAPQHVHFELIETLWRQKYFEKLGRKQQENIKLAFDLGTLCHDMRNYMPPAPYYPVPGTKFVDHVGFLWNDFYVDPQKTVGKRRVAGWVWGKDLAYDVLSWGNSPKVTVHGVYRAHQHNNETGGPMLNLLCCGKGIANVWDSDRVYTLVSASTSKLDETGEECFTYDSFVILTVAEKFKDWQMDHYYQDNGMDVKSWKHVSNQERRSKRKVNGSRQKREERSCPAS